MQSGDKMTIEKAEPVIEALLFTMGEPISADALSLVTGLDRNDVREAVKNLMTRLKFEGRGLRVIELDGSYQMCTAPEMIEQIRGVSCSHVINKLLECGLIMESGRLNAPGRPILFSTTEDFLRTFGVSSVSELPEVAPDMMETIREEAETETGIQIGI